MLLLLFWIRFIQIKGYAIIVIQVYSNKGLCCYCRRDKSHILKRNWKHWKIWSSRNTGLILIKYPSCSKAFSVHTSMYMKVPYHIASAGWEWPFRALWPSVLRLVPVSQQMCQDEYPFLLVISSLPGGDRSVLR